MCRGRLPPVIKLWFQKECFKPHFLNKDFVNQNELFVKQVLDMTWCVVSAEFIITTPLKSLLQFDHECYSPHTHQRSWQGQQQMLQIHSSLPHSKTYRSVKPENIKISNSQSTVTTKSFYKSTCQLLHHLVDQTTGTPTKCDHTNRYIPIPTKYAFIRCARKHMNLPCYWQHPLWSCWNSPHTMSSGIVWTCCHDRQAPGLRRTHIPQIFFWFDDLNSTFKKIIALTLLWNHIQIAVLQKNWQILPNLWTERERQREREERE